MQPKIWITSDLHFWHNNILRYNPVTRVWNTVEEMNIALIEEWNSKVAKGDIIYHNGDFSFGSPAKTEEILRQLNGQKVFIEGNHDRGKNRTLLKKYGEYHTYKEVNWVSPDGKKIKVCLFHFPMEEWNVKHHGSIHLHGHCHGTKPRWGRRLDVGYDSLGKIYSLDEVCQWLYTCEPEYAKGDHQ